MTTTRKEIGAFVYLLDERPKKGRCLKVMLVSNRKQTRWILPKGQPEPDLSDKRVALDEAYEEAGVIGKVDKCFSRKVIKYRSSSGKVRLHLYVVKVQRIVDTWPEHFFRQRRLVDVDVALLMIRKKALRKAVADIAAEVLAASA